MRKNNYSVPLKVLDHDIDVIATHDRIRIFEGHRLLCEHVREEDGANQRKILPEHKQERRQQRPLKSAPCPHEQELVAIAPEFAELTHHLKSRHPGRAVRALRRLHQLYLDYPTDQLRFAIRRALDHSLYDLSRIEAIVLTKLSGSFFRESQDLSVDDAESSTPEDDSPILLPPHDHTKDSDYDEMGYLNLRPEQSNAFFKLMHERYAKRSTIITTNLDYPQWYDFLGNKKMVKALLDRLRHRCHTVRIQGESLREPQG